MRDDTPEWACDTPRRKLSQPYSLGEMLSWLKNNIFGPSHKFKNLTQFIPQYSVQNRIKPTMKLGFLGDIMKMRGKTLQIDPKVQDFFQEVDFLIGNFEGTISDANRVFMAQEHGQEILDSLETLFPPERFVLGCANNHSGDFGWNEFNKSYKMLQDRGFQVFGRKDEPAVMLNKVNVVCCTIWSNQRCKYIPYLKEAGETFNEDAAMNILYPHWGYEQQLYPNPKQIEEATQLLEHWDLIIGHHSHCPQPITAFKIHQINKIVGFSLGDFCTHLNLEKYRYGMVVKCEIGPSAEGLWHVGEVEWKFTHVEPIEKELIDVRLVTNCRYFDDKLKIFGD